MYSCLMKKALGRVKSSIRNKMNQVPLWAEFTLFLAVIMMLFTTVLSYYIYNREQNRNIDAELKANHSLLNLRMANMEDYINALSGFAIMPVYSSDFYAMLLTKDPLDEASVESIRSTVHSYFYTRSDVLSYHMYLLNQKLNIGRNSRAEVVRVNKAHGFQNMDSYKQCLENPKNYALLPPLDASALMRFAHSIIRIEDRSIVAIVEFEVDESSIAYLASQNAGPREIICLYNGDGDLLYTTAPEAEKAVLRGFSAEENASLFLEEETVSRPVYRMLGEENYLLARTKSNDGELYMTSLVPVADVLSQVKQTRRFALMIGGIFLFFAVLAAHMLIRYLSAPLTALVQYQKDFGEGRAVTSRLGRSRESAELSRSFNEMTSRINALVQKNYVAELNEKNAKLAALEAQVNPHFLYNTLQAIGTEALLNDQTSIYKMLTGLASNLRYSIKAENVVPLSDELKYVDNYIMLQQCRMGSRLQVNMMIEPEALSAPIPKISVQPLIENSILHGMEGDRDSIRILLTIRMSPEKLYIQVSDDGVGIPEEKVEELRQNFKSQTLADKNQSIGLANLYNRLLILYGDQIDLTIESKTGEKSYTVVELQVPRTRLNGLGE